MIPLDDVLEALDLSRAEPGAGLLQALFERFNACVPFETATKIVRDEEVSAHDDKPRRPEIFWADHLALGAGGTCFARVAAFDAVLSALGFSSRRILGRVSRDFDHAALVVEAGGKPWLCDVGFPLPALLPLEGEEVETPHGTVFLGPSPRGRRIELGGVPEGPREVELFLAPVSDAEFQRLWRETFRPQAKFLSAVALRRQFDNRVVSFAAGCLRVDDRHSRLEIPLASERPARLAEIFGLEASLLGRAFARVGDPPPREGPAILKAYLEIDARTSDAFSAIASPTGYRRLLEGVAAIVAQEETPEGWVFRLSPPQALPGAGGEIEEQVTPCAAELRLDVERRAETSRSESFFQAFERGGKRYLLRGLRLSASREDLLRNDSLRGRLAGALAVDLLAWARMLEPREEAARGGT